MVYLEINDDSSQKFWKIEKDTSKKVIVTNWGKIGGNPRTKEEPYEDEAKADAQIAKMIKQKMVKGYTSKEKIVLTKQTKKVSNATPVKSAKPIKECPEGKKLNPATGRCIKIKPQKHTKKVVTKAKTTVPKPAIEENKLSESSKGDVVYDVVKNGVMLAHTYKDPHSGKLKNPVKGFPPAPKGWYASEKFDGYRAIWDGVDFRSRTGKVFVAPDWFKAWLPKDVALDGELFMGRECFEKCGIFRKKVPNDKEWREADVTYQIFDMPSLKAPFEDRVHAIDRIVKELCERKMPSTMGKCPLRVTSQKKVESEEEVFKMFDGLVAKGAEGVMLRCPGSPYDPKRSAHLLKVKPFFDAECKVIGYKPGTGKYKGKLGAFHCETVKAPKAKFYISGMSDDIRGNYKQTHPVGTIVTYTYVGVGESGVPRHPNYLRKREVE